MMKRMKSLSPFLVILALCFSFFSALAGQDETPPQSNCNQDFNHHCGVYIQADMGTNIAFESVDLFGVSLSSTQWGGYGINGNFGYLFIPYVGLDIGFTDYTSTVQILPSLHSAHIAVKGVLPLGSRFNLAVKLGTMLVFAHDSAAEIGIFAPYIGASAGVALTKHLDFDVMFQGGGITKWGAKAAIALLSAGFTYHFFEPPCVIQEHS